MKFRLFKNKSWSISDFSPPWNGRKSIYWHIANHIREDTLGLAEGGVTLPDEEIVRGDSSFGWAAGAVDSVLGSPAEGKPADARVSELYDRLVRLTDESTDANLECLINQITSQGVISIVDGLLGKICDGFPEQDRLHTVARWLAMEAADREAVKLAISILGLFRDEHDQDLLMTLGRHEEFTLFVVVAIQNSEVDVENKLWKLAQHVRGWGRIHIVERLAPTQDTYIKDWLVREGFRNEIMYEYTALICARAGELFKKLSTERIDAELVNAAGEILGALLGGSGPAEGYESYEEGPSCYERYLEILSGRQNELDALVFADRIDGFLNDEQNFSKLSPDLKREWESRRPRMVSSISQIRNQSGWEERVRQQLAVSDSARFWVAAEAAKILGIDPWEHYFERIKRGEDYWWNALQTEDVDRIDALVTYAEKTIPLEKLATGPADAVGKVDDFAEHLKLDWLLQELRRYPGKGLRLVQAGLRSPSVRSRNMAVRALAAVPLVDRTEEAQQWLADAHAIEPNVETKKQIMSAIVGEQLAE